jgi:ABC-2 type transport system ATP-binding protein
MTASIAVEACGLVRSFSHDRALDGVDLTVPAGTVFGILGPNGAGKTTTIRILATLLRPDAGSARVFGYDVVDQADAVRARICLTGQSTSIDGDLTGLENLEMIARLLGATRRRARARADELLELFELGAAAGRPVRSWSGGMRRRIELAASVIVSPPLLFLDEPTTGLDPRSRNQIWDIVRRMADDGTTVLLTTQYLAEADQLAGRVAVFDRGRVIAEGTPAELKASIGASRLEVRVQQPADAGRGRDLLSRRLDGVAASPSDPTVLIAVVPNAARGVDAVGELTRAGVSVADFSLAQPSLDDVFLTLTAHHAEPAAADLEGSRP